MAALTRRTDLNPSQVVVFCLRHKVSPFAFAEAPQPWRKLQRLLLAGTNACWPGTLHTKNCFLLKDGRSYWTNEQRNQPNGCGTLWDLSLGRFLHVALYFSPSFPLVKSVSGANCFSFLCMPQLPLLCFGIIVHSADYTCITRRRHIVSVPAKLDLTFTVTTQQADFWVPVGFSVSRAQETPLEAQTTIGLMHFDNSKIEASVLRDTERRTRWCEKLFCRQSCDMYLASFSSTAPAWKPKNCSCFCFFLFAFVWLFRSMSKSKCQIKCVWKQESSGKKRT